MNGWTPGPVESRIRNTMKTYPKLALAAVALILLQSPAFTQSVPEAVKEAEISTPAKLTRHQKLCAQLGLRVNGRYEFRLTGDQVHYYEIRSLGANGWILAKGYNYPDAWVNLSQVISVTLVPSKAFVARPAKPNERK